MHVCMNGSVFVCVCVHVCVRVCACVCNLVRDMSGLLDWNVVCLKSLSSQLCKSSLCTSSTSCLFCSTCPFQQLVMEKHTLPITFACIQAGNALVTRVRHNGRLYLISTEKKKKTKKNKKNNNNKSESVGTGEPWGLAGPRQE